MRIAIIADHIYPDAAGGTWNYAYEMGRRLAGRGHTVVAVVAKTSPAQPGSELVDGIEVRRYALPGHLHAARFAVRILRARSLLRCICAERAVQVVAIQSVVTGFAALAGPACVRRVPRVLTFHGAGVKREASSNLGACSSRLGRLLRTPYLDALHAVERLVVRSAHALAAPSRYGASQLSAMHGVPLPGIEIVPIGVDVERFRPAPPDRIAGIRRELGWPAAAKVLLSVRRLIPRMGLIELVEAMPRLGADHPGAVLMIGGAGPLEAGLKQRIAALGLESKVRMLGFVPANQLPKCYQAADLSVVPSADLEGFGMVTIESLACGTPVLGTRSGGTPEILEPLDGRLLVDRCTPEELAGGIGAALGRLGPSCRERCRDYAAGRYGWDRIIERVERLHADRAIPC